MNDVAIIGFWFNIQLIWKMRRRLSLLIVKLELDGTVEMYLEYVIKVTITARRPYGPKLATTR